MTTTRKNSKPKDVPAENAETTVPDISGILDQIKAKESTAQAAPQKPPASKKTKLPKVEDVPRGIAKSGRPWKTPKQKFSTIKKTLNRRTFEKKEALRNDLKHIKEMSKTIKEDRVKQNEYKKKRRDENAQKRLENERKSEVVQVIKNPAKLKRLKKKQLRMIEKRDFDKVKVV